MPICQAGYLIREGHQDTTLVTFDSVYVAGSMSPHRTDGFIERWKLRRKQNIYYRPDVYRYYVAPLVESPLAAKNFFLPSQEGPLLLVIRAQLTGGRRTNGRRAAGSELNKDSQRDILAPRGRLNSERFIKTWRNS